MNIAVIGTGYVGLTTAISFAIRGHDVTCLDVDHAKIEQLKNGILPIYEPQMDDAFRQVQEQHPIRFTSSVQDVAQDHPLYFLCVGTPSDTNGKADLTYVIEAIDTLKERIPVSNDHKAVVLKSTVPIGTASRVAKLLSVREDLIVVSNPEFLREGSALVDSLHPSRIVIGTQSAEAKSLMDEVYANFQAPVLYTTWNNAEMIKYASNAFLATKISFMNELARLCERVGADITMVAQGMGLDSRIGGEFLRAGIGYGGSCFPKDTAALVTVAHDHQVELSIVERAMRVNQSQTEWFLQKLNVDDGDWHGKKIAILGLSFKPDTDDIREAPSLAILKQLTGVGAKLVTYDPVASYHVRRLYPAVTYVSTPYEALDQANVAILVTEWKELVELDWTRVHSIMKSPVLLDGRNVWPVEELRALGFEYTGVGR